MKFYRRKYFTRFFTNEPGKIENEEIKLKQKKETKKNLSYSEMKKALRV
jgi:hypothetical protein